MTIWFGLWLFFSLSLTDPIPISKILLVRDNLNLPALSFKAVIELEEELTKVVPYQEFANQNITFQELKEGPNIRQLTVAIKDQFLNPITKALELNQFIGTILKDDRRETQILLRQGKFVVSKEGALVGYRIGLSTEIQHQLVVVHSPAPKSPSLTGWLIDFDSQSSSDRLLFISTESPVIWLKAEPEGFSVHLPKGSQGQELMAVGEKIVTANNLIIYRFAISFREFKLSLPLKKAAR